MHDTRAIGYSVPSGCTWEVTAPILYGEASLVRDTGRLALKCARTGAGTRNVLASLNASSHFLTIATFDQLAVVNGVDAGVWIS